MRGYSYFKAFLLVIYLAAGAVVSSDAYARAQRMAIAPGSYNIGPRGSTLAQAYCLDFARAVPSGRNRYTQVFSDPGSVAVRIGGQRMSLQQAIAEGKLAVRGPRGNEEVSGDLNIPLAFDNLTDQPVAIEIRSHAVLAEAGDSAPRVDALDIANAAKSGNAREAQSKMWAAEMLNELGFSKLGESAASRSQAVRRFQAKYLIQETGQLDESTTWQLNRLQSLAKYNKSSAGRYAVLQVSKDNFASGNFYRVQVYGEAPRLVIKTSEIAALAASEAKRTGAQTVFVSPSGMTEKETQALAATLRVQVHGARGRVALTLPSDLDTLPSSTKELRELEYEMAERAFVPMETRQVKVEVGSVELKTSGPAKGMYQGDVMVTFDGNPGVLLTVISRAQEWIRYFIARLEVLIRGADPDKVSLTSLVLQARADLKRQYNLSDEEVDKAFRTNILQTQIVNLFERLHLRTVIADMQGS